jgi:hypothetical protein
MAMKRRVTVGFGGPGKIEKVTVMIPSEWITGTRDAMVEVTENEKLRTMLSINPGAALWVEISDPFDDEYAIIR